MNLQSLQPIHSVELFPPLAAELLDLLRCLSPADWAKPTVCAPWTVKDVTAHLLGGSIGRLSFGRDRPAGSTPAAPVDFDQLLAWINESNAAWVKAAEKISPNLLIDFLAVTDIQLYEYFKSLPMDSTTHISVAWAGEEESLIWFDIAREYTEKWMHQQHIREAVGAPLLTSRRFYHPVLDAFLRALPYTYRSTPAPDGTSVVITIPGEAGGAWTLLREAGQWRQYLGALPHPSAEVEIDPALAWRLFTKGISPEQARPQVQIRGDAALGAVMLNMVSIMA